MEISKKQIQTIQVICSSRFADRLERLDYMSAFFKREIKSTKELTFIEAEDLIYFLNTGQKSNTNWAFFDSKKFVAERKTLFSLMHQAQWVKPHQTLSEVPDLDRLSNFLKSPKSPVKKPLKQMEKKEWEKLITAFRGIVKATYK